jgi:hypothetical protein
MDISMAIMDVLGITKRGLQNFGNLNFMNLSYNAQNVSLQYLIDSGFKAFVGRNDILNNLEHTLKYFKSGRYVFSSGNVIYYKKLLVVLN